MKILVLLFSSLVVSSAQSGSSTSYIDEDFVVCNPTLSNETNVKSSKPGITITPAEFRWCMISCQDDAQCVGFDFDATKRHCEIHYAQNFNSKAKSATNVQYTITNICASICHPSWTVVHGQSSSGAIEITEILAGNTTALTGCLEYCARRVADCVAVEYTPNTNPSATCCKYFKTTASIGSSHNAPQTTQYILANPCAEYCVTSYVLKAGTNYDGLVQTRNSTTSFTLAACDLECQDDPNCVIYTYPSDPTAPFYCEMSNFYTDPYPEPTVNSVVWEASCSAYLNG